MKLFKSSRNDSGQILTSVVIFMAFGLSIIALSAALTIINMQNTAKTQEGAKALNYAEAGAEEGFIRIIRDPAYAGGVLTIDPAATVTVVVTGDAVNKVVVSTAVYNGFTRKVQVNLQLADGKVNLVSWKQII